MFMFKSFALLIRPWHDAPAIARAWAVTHANQEKGRLGER